MPQHSSRALWVASLHPRPAPGEAEVGLLHQAGSGKWGTLSEVNHVWGWNEHIRGHPPELLLRLFQGSRPGVKACTQSRTSAKCVSAGDRTTTGIIRG